MAKSLANTLFSETIVMSFATWSFMLRTTTVLFKWRTVIILKNTCQPNTGFKTKKG
jgi:hypothetical protein